jgi:hypothetical protein
MASRARRPDEIVTFPIRVTGELWNRVTDQAHRDERSVHAVVVEFLEHYAAGRKSVTATKPKGAKSK